MAVLPKVTFRRKKKTLTHSAFVEPTRIETLKYPCVSSKEDGSLLLVSDRRTKEGVSIFVLFRRLII